MVTVLLCFAGRGHPLPETLASLRGQDVELVDVSYHPANYPQALARVWADAEDFVNVEHDVVVPTGALEQFAMCPESWCYHGYDGQRDAYPSLGLVRFRADVLAAEPGMWEQYLHRAKPVGLNPDTMQPIGGTDADDSGLPPWLNDPPWVHCDEWAAMWLLKAGHWPHQHYPDAVNL